jgi:hypothetical protein
VTESKSSENDNAGEKVVLPPSVKKEQAKKAKSSSAPVKAASTVNPRWLVPTMLGLMIAGLVYVVVAYLAQMQYPIPGIRNWNLVVGFALMIAGFGLTTRWK